LETDNNLPKIRAELLTGFQNRLVPMELFDKFQVVWDFRELVAIDQLRPENHLLLWLEREPHPG
jgi:hypothetical protein